MTRRRRSEVLDAHHFHAVRFYKDSRELCDIVAKFIIEGLHAGQPVLASAAKARPGAVVRAYGEMVNILWQRGLGSAATRLETLWNHLARTENFALMCGYSMGNFYKDSDIEKICSQHSYVVDTAARFPTVIAH